MLYYRLKVKMKPFAGVVRPELMAMSTEAPLLAQNIKDGRPSYPSMNASSLPWSRCNTAAESKLNAFSAGQKHPYSPSYSRDLKTHNVSSVIKGSLLPFLAKDRSAMTKCTSENNVTANDISRHFLFDERWRNGTYIRNDIGDDVVIKQNSTISGLMPCPEFHVYRSQNLARFAHRKGFSLANPKPLILGAEYLTTFTSVLLPATIPSVSGRLCLSHNYTNRSRINNRARNLFTVGAKNKTQSYPDPLLGATASFVQRLTEISSLEAETVRQEKIRRLKKINRQDS